MRAEDNGVALTPPLGWSSWSALRYNPTEAKIEAQAAAMKSSGLADHGFIYINVDDFYYLDPRQTVDAYGRWAIDPAHFPNGMKPVADYVHSLGLKFGMYITPGIPVAAYNQNTPIEGTSYHAKDVVTNTTAHPPNYNFTNVNYFLDYSRPGAQEFLNSWARLLASWGVDYIKIDGVTINDLADVQAWSKALKNSGRDIAFGLSNTLDPNYGALWKRYSNAWRTNGDIEAYGSNGPFPLTNWNNVSQRFQSVPQFTAWAGPGDWNDLDSLEVGDGSNDGLTMDERVSAMTLWSIARSSLLLGTDLTSLVPEDVALLTNDEVLAVDQQSGSSVGVPLSYNTAQQVWTLLENDGSYVVALFNTANSVDTVGVAWTDLGFNGQASVRDLWARTDLGTTNTGFVASIPLHGARLLRVVPVIPIQRYTAGNPANVYAGGAFAGRSNVGSDGYTAQFVGEGASVTFNGINVSRAGTYNVTLSYANGDSNARAARITVNSGASTTTSFAPTGSYSTRTTLTVTLPLAAGTNSITIDNPSGYAPDFDAIVIQAPALTTAAKPVKAQKL